MYIYIHPSYAYADLHHKVCGAGVYACVFNPAPHPWCSALSVRLVDQCIYQVDLRRST